MTAYAHRDGDGVNLGRRSQTGLPQRPLHHPVHLESMGIPGQPGDYAPPLLVDIRLPGDGLRRPNKSGTGRGVSHVACLRRTIGARLVAQKAVPEAAAG